MSKLMVHRFSFIRLIFTPLLLLCASEGRAAFDLEISISNTGFTAAHRAALQEAADATEALWESKITGYQSGISLTGITVNIIADQNAFAYAQPTGNTTQGGFFLFTQGTVGINPAVIDLFESWDGTGPTIPNTEFVGVNYVDDIIAHEVGHILGLNGNSANSAWVRNGLYQTGSGQYTGTHGVAAYRAEFDPTAQFIPVELAGGPGSPDAHWDQIFRSNMNPNQQEGVLDSGENPFDLDPRTGITDPQGRDLAFELMTGAIDPDWGEPYLSNTTVQSLRDLGFTVVPEPGSAALLLFGSFFLLGRPNKR